MLSVSTHTGKLLDFMTLTGRHSEQQLVSSTSNKKDDIGLVLLKYNATVVYSPQMRAFVMFDLLFHHSGHPYNVRPNPLSIQASMIPFQKIRHVSRMALHTYIHAKPSQQPRHSPITRTGKIPRKSICSAADPPANLETMKNDNHAVQARKQSPSPPRTSTKKGSLTPIHHLGFPIPIARLPRCPLLLFVLTARPLRRPATLTFLASRRKSSHRRRSHVSNRWSRDQ